MPTWMKERAVLEVSGADARDYLQALVTNDVAGMKPGEALWAGLLTPQGKILFDFFINDVGPDAEGAPRFLLDVPAARIDALAQRMNLYRLRRAVEIRPREDLAVAVDVPVDDASLRAARAAGEDALVHDDPRFAPMGTRAVLPAMRARAFDDDARAWHARRIRLGLPDSEADIGEGRLFPHEANFDCLNGVSFTKGCYVGQEVVSRMQHRATVRNRLVPIRADAALAAGMTVTDGEKRIGTVFSTTERDAIALIRLDRAAAARRAGRPLLAEGAIPLRLARPAWACFEMPESA